MARQPRIALAGRPHFLTQTSEAEKPAFVDDHDRRFYAGAMHECARSAGVLVHAYALGLGHAQILATPETAEGLARFMQRLGRRYVAAFNRRHQTVGRLWASRFGSTALVSEQYLLDALLATEQLPVREGCATSAGEWTGSSAAHHLGWRSDSRLSDPTCYWALGNTPFERQARYAELLNTSLPQSQVSNMELAARRGWPLGRVEDVDDLQRVAPHAAMKPKPRGRPRNL